MRRTAPTPPRVASPRQAATPAQKPRAPTSSGRFVHAATQRLSSDVTILTTELKEQDHQLDEMRRRVAEVEAAQRAELVAMQGHLEAHHHAAQAAKQATAEATALELARMRETISKLRGAIAARDGGLRAARRDAEEAAAARAKEIEEARRAAPAAKEVEERLRAGEEKAKRAEEKAQALAAENSKLERALNEEAARNAQQQREAPGASDAKAAEAAFKKKEHELARARWSSLVSARCWRTRTRS